MSIFQRSPIKTSAVSTGQSGSSEIFFHFFITSNRWYYTIVSKRGVSNFKVLTLQISSTMLLYIYRAEKANCLEILKQNNGGFNMKYLVTGATGGYGTYALGFLKELVPISDIAVLARTEEKAAPLKAAGFDVRLADYSDLTALEQAFTGIDRLLFVSGAPGNRQAEHQNVVDAAKSAGISYIAYTSFPQAERATSDLAADHIYTEKAIEKSGIAYTFLRNNWYFENEMPIIAAALSTGKFVYNAPTGKVGWALKREYAEVGAKALAGVDFPEVLELSGKRLTYAELAQVLKSVSDKDFEVIIADDKTFVSHLVETGLPDFVAELFLGFQKDIEAKDLDVESKDFEKALGHSLTDTKEALKELLA